MSPPISSRRSNPRTSAPAGYSTPRRKADALRLKAIIFDVDGTLAETEEAHRAAFNQAFAEAGLAWHWSENAYRALLTTTGGRERIIRYIAERKVAAGARQVAALHLRKNAIYADLVANGAVAPRPGVVRLIEAARARGIVLAIATTTSHSNLIALLVHVLGADAPTWFAAIVTGEDVARKKPDAEAYVRALAALALDPADCIAIEDSRHGLDAARAAGIATIVTPSHYTSPDSFMGAAVIAPNLDSIDLETLEALLGP